MQWGYIKQVIYSAAGYIGKSRLDSPRDKRQIYLSGADRVGEQNSTSLYTEST